MEFQQESKESGIFEPLVNIKIPMVNECYVLLESVNDQGIK